MTPKEIRQRAATKHGWAYHPLYRAYISMHDRCYNPKCCSYRRYGGRGIYVSDEWHDAGAYCNWAIANGWKRGLTVDRKDNNGPYAPWNCRIATQKEQGNNRRTNLKILYNGEVLSLTAAAEKSGFKRSTLKGRLDKGWPMEKLFNPLKINQHG